MKLVKQDEKDLMHVYNTWWHSYLNGDIKTYDSYLADHYRFIGSTNNEDFLNRKDTTKFFKDTAEQMAGKAELRNLERTMDVIQKDLVLFTDLADAFVLSNSDWVYYSRFRFTSLIKKTKDGWRFTYQHFSAPDTKAQEDETLGTEKITKENQELRDAIKRRTFELENTNRELAIEAALERVRARTMAMQHSDELAETSYVLFEQFKNLGETSEQIYIGIFNEEENFMELYSTLNGSQWKEPANIDLDEPMVMKKIYANWKKNKKSLVINLEGNNLKKYNAYREKLSTLKYKEKRWVIHVAFFSKGVLTFSSSEPHPNEIITLLERFAGVFDGTYTRFQDLKKAEAQAKEVQIELALERVRSRSMAMHTSEELTEAGELLYHELSKLGVQNLSTGYTLLDETATMGWSYGVNPFDGSIRHKPVGMNHTTTRVMKAIAASWKKQEPILVIQLNERETIKHQTFIAEESIGFPISKEKLLSISPERLVVHTFNFKQGYLLIVGGELLSVEPQEMITRFAKVFQQTYTRFLDLQKAEAQARESQIELALERVRARTMAMQKSEELKEVIQTVYDQFINLKINIEHTGFIIDYKENDDMHIWLADKNEVATKIILPYFDNAHWNSFKEAKAKGENFFANKLTFKEKNKFYKDLFKLISDVPEGLLEIYLNYPGLAISTVLLDNVGLYIENFEGIPYSEEENNTLMRFGKVFQQTYTRFLDLQKAEAQAKEAQIEAALERVRSRTMAMHKSDELPEAGGVLYQELTKLDINSLTIGYVLMDESEKIGWNYTANPADGTIWEVAVGVPHDETDIMRRLTHNWKKQKPFSVIKMDAKETIAHQTFIAERGINFPYTAVELISFSPEKIVLSNFNFKQGYLLIVGDKELQQEEKEMMVRFTKVFQQTYTRFLDLQKAEAQAREAQIEAALEKIRSRSLAMQNPYELQEVVAVVAEKLHELGVIFDAGGVILCTYFPDNKDVVHWIAVDDFSTSGRYLLPYFENPIFSDAWNSKIRGDSYYSKEFSVEAKNHFFEYAFEHTDYKHFPEDYKQFVLQADKHRLSAAWSKNSAILIPSLTGAVPSESDAEIMKRFAKVFEQAYIRFMDLQKAETLAQEAKIEVALERVRARALAMQEPEELKEVAKVLRHEMGLLGVEELETCSIYINDKKTEEAECWYALRDIRTKGKKLVNDYFALNFKDTWVGREMLQFYNSKKEQTSIQMTGKNRVEWIRYCEKHSKPFRGHYGEVIPDRIYHLYKFSNGAIGAAAAGDISVESWNLLKRAAAVFSLAYSRFKDLTQARFDLKQLKEEKKKAEDALADLKITQSQLIQSEKMASLGELTAGIAHEIQNPLNFVNNFSEVSQELIDELKEELENGNMEDVKEILEDVIQNLEKINHHGKRAEAIVKGMLQHSRKSTAEKEPTDINKLADEYLRLAYHGLRAKDKSFNATLETDFDENIGMVNVIPQDLGRVILNLITNAFYAISPQPQEGALSKIKNKKPTVWVSTKRISPLRGGKGGILISVKDNGNGIPKKIIDKIFQPFFTTKPTGQGTGLGLSMSYDIVTKGHGGELTVETKEGEGTTFSIKLTTN